jgi:adenosylcobinamide-GDP ribazoletransferase
VRVRDRTVRMTGPLGTARETGPLAPLVGALIGALGGAVYWLAVQIWPSSVAVIVSMAATVLLTGRNYAGMPATRLDAMSAVLSLLIKYNALMALSAAKLPFAVAPNVPLVLIMICGYAASFALLVSVMAARPATPSAGTHSARTPSARMSGAELAIALVIGFAPAALLGIPGLFGLAAAIVAGMGIIGFLKFKRTGSSSDVLVMTQLITEACFYLGALATWRYV